MKYVRIDKVFIVAQTDKAVLIEVDEQQYWIPWSCVEDNNDDYYDGYEGPIYVSEWYAEREGLV